MVLDQDHSKTFWSSFRLNGTSESTWSSAALVPPAASGFTASESTQEKTQCESFSFSIKELPEGPVVLNVLKVPLRWQNLELVSAAGALRPPLVFVGVLLNLPLFHLSR